MLNQLELVVACDVDHIRSFSCAVLIHFTQMCEY